MLWRVRGAAVAVGIAALVTVRGAQGATPANHCFELSSVPGGRSHGRFYVKPTGHGVLLYDRGRRLLGVGSENRVVRTATPGPAAEWRLRRSGTSFVLRSTAGGRVLAESGRSLVTVPAGGHSRARLFRFPAARGCKTFPEANVGATAARSGSCSASRTPTFTSPP